MKKYIDADELKKVFRYTEDAEYARWTLVGILGEIDDIEAADMVEVLRCKDCIYHTEDNVCANRRWDNWSNSDYESPYPEMLDMDYCSYGVRKDG